MQLLKVYVIGLGDLQSAEGFCMRLGNAFDDKQIELRRIEVVCIYIKVLKARFPPI